MRKWFRRTEKRQSGVTVADLRLTSEVYPQSVAGTAAVEAAVGAVARAGAMGEWSGRWSGLMTPGYVSFVMRQLIVSGDVVVYIDVDGDMVTLVPTRGHEVSGGYRERDLLYQIELAGATHSETKVVLAEQVLHYRYSIDAVNPFRGIGPLARAGVTLDALQRLSNAVSSHGDQPVGTLLRVPAVDGGDDGLKQLASDIKTRLGRELIVVEGGDVGMGESSRPHDWSPTTIGPAPDKEANVALDAAARGVLAAIGAPADLFEAKPSAVQDTTRRFVSQCIVPLGRIVREETAKKLDSEDLAVDWTALRSADAQARSRAFSNVAESLGEQEAKKVAGMEPTK